jgi:flagellar hook-length control protein FliK
MREVAEVSGSDGGEATADLAPQTEDHADPAPSLLPTVLPVPLPPRVASTDGSAPDLSRAEDLAGEREPPSMQAELVIAKVQARPRAPDAADFLEIKTSILRQETHLAAAEPSTKVLNYLAARALPAALKQVDLDASDGAAKSADASLGPVLEDEHGDGLSEAITRVQRPFSTAEQDAGGSLARQPAETSLSTLPRDDARTNRSAGKGDKAVVIGGGATAPLLASPLQQIARQIVGELKSAPPAISIAAESLGGASSPPLEGVVKVLHIALDPPNLGVVTIRLTLKDNALDLKIEASRRDTAHVIEDGHEALSKALKSAGYSVDGISTLTAEPPRSVAPGQPAASSTPSALSSAPQSESHFPHSHRRGEGNPSRGSSRDSISSGVNDNVEAPSRAAGGAIYV